MNIVVAVKDYTELDRMVRPLAAVGHQVTPVTKYATLLRTLGVLRADAVLLDWGFGGTITDEQAIKSVRGPDPVGGPRVLMMMPERWPADASQLFGWGADDFVRRPMLVPELLLRVEQLTAGIISAPADGLRGAPREWRDAPFWRDLEQIVDGELGATIGVTLQRTAVPPAATMAMAGLSRLLLVDEGLELIVGVGVDVGQEGPLAALLLGGPPTPELLGDVVTELTNVAAGAIKRSALSAGKSFAMGLPRLHTDAARTFGLERQWRCHGDHGIELHCMAAARSSRPEVVLCGSLREGMIVNNNVTSPSGMLLAAQGTCLTERSVEKLRSMLGDRYAVEVTLPGASS